MVHPGTLVVLHLAITVVLLGMGAILLFNWRSFPHLADRGAEVATAPRPGGGPIAASFLIPARNEAAVIGSTVRALLDQKEAVEVLVLDDHSTDGTATAAWAAGNGDPRLRVLHGEALPSGWLGKNWACRQLAAAARGQILIFTDADVHWSPGALAALLDEMESTDADLLTIWPTQQTVTWGERLVVPLMAMVVHAYLPVLLVHHTSWPLFAAANGQCLAFRRPAYEAVGGHDAVRDNVLEDVTLARRIKARGLRLRMAEGHGFVRCRMYRSWPEVRHGFAKNILKGYGSATGLVAATLFHWLVFLGPWLFLLLGLVIEVPGWPVWPLGLAGAGLLVRMWTAYQSGQRVADGLLMPLSVLAMTGIAAQALWWRWRHGGPLWKGRVVGS